MHEPLAIPLHGDFVLLRSGRLRLLLPQAEVGAAEYLDPRPLPSERPGLLLAGDRCVAALSEQMTLLPECPPARFIVAALGDGAERIGWCWDELRVLIGVDLTAIALPPMLVGAHTPVDRYAEHDGELAYLCSAERLAGFALASGVAP